MEANTSSRTQKKTRPRGKKSGDQRHRNPKDPGPTRQTTGRHARRQKANERPGGEMSGQARGQASKQAEARKRETSSQADTQT